MTLLETTPAAHVVVDRYTDIVGPSYEMFGPVQDGGTIEFRTVPGCWGPMMTPSLRSGHEVTLPVAVAGARVGDALVITVEELQQISGGTSSGTSANVEGNYLDDPFIAGICPTCRDAGRDYFNPATYLDGTGEQAVRCKACGSAVNPFTMSQGYTMVFDEQRQLGITLSSSGAREIARTAREWVGLSEFATQHPIVALAKADLIGVAVRCRVSVGNLGTIPAIDLPSSHNAGDFGSFLVGARHAFGITDEQLEQRTDAHMDIDTVRKGTTLIVPVKVDGGGVYAGDVHALIGDGEVAGHAADVSARLVVRVHVLKDVALEGPILLPAVEDLPFLAKPFSEAESAQVAALASRHQTKVEGPRLPIQIVGSAPFLNAAVDNGLERATKLLGMTSEEVRNRATISGAVEIGRLPGLVQINMLVPMESLTNAGIAAAVVAQYGEPA